MNNKKESVAKGGGSVMGARLLGMVLSFLLFLVLARHSPAYAGIFRTVLTYLVMAEFLGMLGMHRWLATEMAANPQRQWGIFTATNAVMLGVAVLLILIYGAVSFGEIYSPETNQGLRLATLSLIPSAIYQCVQSALVGIGNTYRVGIYNATEYIARCTISIALIYLGFSVVDIVLVFVISRWAVALFGLYELKRMLQGHIWLPEKSDIAHALKDAPRFLLIIAAFMALRNAAIVLIPALVNDAEVAYYAVAYQLFDMILIIPSVLAISSNHVFVNKANHSGAALRNVSIQFLSVTAIAMFPCIAITAAFAHNFLLFLYGSHYTIAGHTLALLMLASGIAMVDQALSQIVTARKDYHSDMIAILVGGVSAIVLTYFMARHDGATGAAMAFLIASVLTVIVRVQMLKKLFPFKLLWLSVLRPSISAILIFVLAVISLQLPAFAIIADSKYLWILCVPALLAVYAAILYGIGGVDASRRESVRNFLFHH